MTLLGRAGQVTPNRLPKKDDVRPEQQYDDEQTDVIAVAECLARAGATDEFRMRPGARTHRHDAAAQGLEHRVAWLVQIAPQAQQREADDPPDDAQAKYRERQL